MSSFPEEEHAQFRRQIRLWIAKQSTQSVQPTDEEPGSDAKIDVMAMRYAQALVAEVELPLHHPFDAPVNPNFGYRITKGRNGRIIHKERVPSDQANAQRIAREEALSVLEEIKLSLSTDAPKKKKGRAILSMPKRKPHGRRTA